MEGPLYTDVVMGIVMSHLKVRDLLNCRKVSKFWNKTASSALRKRSTMITRISSEAELMELGECMRESSDFPFAGLKWLREPWRLSSAGAIEFFRNHGASFTSLHLGALSETRIQDLAPFMIHLPRLSILEVEVNKVFCKPNPDAGLLKHAGGMEDGSILILPSLRTLRICDLMNQDFLRQVCTAASPSLHVECLNATMKTLKALECTGKLQAVSAMKIGYRSEDYVLEDVRLLTIESLMLTKLDYGNSLSLDELKKILISSQNTLKNLRLVGINPSQFSSECPVLTKLTTLSLHVLHEPVFQGSQGNKFPALKELKLDIRCLWYNFGRRHFTDDLFIVPSLTRMDISGCTHINMIKDLARSFPNVVEIRLKSPYYTNDLNGMWSAGAFKFLEKLKIWDYSIRCPNKHYMLMDEFLTKASSSMGKNLRKQAHQNLIESPFNEILRKSPSILQLKNLKQLVVCVKLDENLEEFPEELPFISMVSVWYALQMMPNLKAKFVYDYFSPSWGFKEERREKAVAALKAALKHVQPNLELEPFLY